MKFYVKQYKYYCGVDLHARTMCVCIIDEKGTIVKQKNMESGPDEFSKIIKPYREDQPHLLCSIERFIFSHPFAFVRGALYAKEQNERL